VEPTRLIYQKTLFNAMKEKSYSTLVDQVLHHFDCDLGLSLAGDHLCRTVALGAEITVLDMLSFATRQLNIDEGQRAFFQSGAKNVLAKASVQEAYAAPEFMPTQPEDTYCVNMKHVVLQSRASNSRVAANDTQANIELQDLIQALSVLDNKEE